MSLNDQVRVQLRVQSWDASAGHGVVVDRQGFAYPIELSRLSAEFYVVPPRPDEILEGIICGPGKVIGILLSPGTERVRFESVGASPDADAIAQERGQRLEGGRPQLFGTPDNGRFSHPKS